MQWIFKRAAILLLFLSSNLCAFTDFTKNSEINILVLLSFHELLPWSESFKQGLKEARNKYGGNIQFYIENMEAMRLTKSLTDAQWAAYLAKKYQAVKFDAAIAESHKASLFLSQYGPQLLGDIPYIYHTPNNIADYQRSKTFKPQFNDAVAKTWQMALQQNNHAQEVVVVGGQNRMTDNIINILLSLIKKHSELNVTILQGDSVAELQEKLSALPANSIVFYSLLFKDKTGKKLVPKEVLATIAKSASAPIYSFSSSMLGAGTVGGHVHDGASECFANDQCANGLSSTGRF